jgi:hypothetical protein
VQAACSLLQKAEKAPIEDVSALMRQALKGINKVFNKAADALAERGEADLKRG